MEIKINPKYNDIWVNCFFLRFYSAYFGKDSNSWQLKSRESYFKKESWVMWSFAQFFSTNTRKTKKNRRMRNVTLQSWNPNYICPGLGLDLSLVPVWISYFFLLTSCRSFGVCLGLCRSIELCLGGRGWKVSTTSFCTKLDIYVFQLQK